METLIYIGVGALIVVIILGYINYRLIWKSTDGFTSYYEALQRESEEYLERRRMGVRLSEGRELTEDEEFEIMKRSNDFQSDMIDKYKG